MASSTECPHIHPTPEKIEPLPLLLQYVDEVDGNSYYNELLKNQIVLAYCLSLFLLLRLQQGYYSL